MQINELVGNMYSLEDRLIQLMSENGITLYEALLWELSAAIAYDLEKMDPYKRAVIVEDYLDLENVSPTLKEFYLKLLDHKTADVVLTQS